MSAYGEPAKQAKPQAKASPSATCPSVYTCYAKCTTEDCVAACDAGVDPAVVLTTRAFAMCSIQNKCTDTACQQTKCGAQLQACMAGPQTARPAATAQAHTQLWMGLRQTGVGSSYTANVGWYVLFDDGRVLATLPSEGLDGFSENSVANDLGTWRLNNGSVEMAFQNYRPMFTPRKDGGFDSREGSFWPAEHLDGATLDGAYAPRSGPADIAFTSDGRFQSNGGLMIFTAQNGLSPTPKGQGTYRIANNTLTLAYSTGQVVRISIATLKAKELPRASSVFFGGFEYHRT